mmetsp:Transcript_46055/g.68602  ORF Transcript_46055/g.68602 Transcript_46055/m.68602 type:complete len:219 (-) Transcript_46055:84-740(-)|eukprot:CAMPEP_0194052728 /NCGR_PEP_ID=MMETSP0009_2-20130614/46730_1 /TAXON_ID=210454 /ORGANISM="Grammatophora oceanica, Strain CCMP 410" /LENGTH=218 /DNA_ID=CAMNT_0038700467 /DNA_START=37 /DNA_END=693 /DNA_ORIENTATION=+
MLLKRRRSSLATEATYDASADNLSVGDESVVSRHDPSTGASSPAVEVDWHLKDQLCRYCKEIGLFSFIVTDDDCFILSGRLLFKFEDCGNGEVRIMTVIHSVKDEDDQRRIADKVDDVQKQIETNKDLSLIIWDYDQGCNDVLLMHRVKVDLLYEEYYDEFEELLDDFLDLAHETSSKLKKASTPFRAMTRKGLLQRVRPRRKSPPCEGIVVINAKES